jgi:hypothetical protein
MKTASRTQPTGHTQDEEAICPLCEQITAHRELYCFYNLDLTGSYRATLEVIRAYHPDWIERDGICPRCWKSYADATRVIHTLRFRHPV